MLNSCQRSKVKQFCPQTRHKEVQCQCQKSSHDRRTAGLNLFQGEIFFSRFTSAMTQYLPPNLLALFAPREPIPYFAPLDKLPWEKKPWAYAGVSQYLGVFEVGGCRE